MGKSEMTRRKRCDFDNIICSPFLLTSISIAVFGWAIAFISSIAANARDSNFSHFAWWAVMYQFCVITGIVVAVLFDATDNYQLAICAFLASALSFTSSTANALIYSSSGAQEAAAAGHIFLSITNVIWILYFGTTPSAAPHAWVDGLAMRGPMVPDGRPTPGENGLYPNTRYGTPYPKSMIGPENTQTVGPPSPAQPSVTSTSFNAKANRETVGTVTTSLAQGDLNFNYRAKAIYSYDANPEDPNEISFTKGEILEVAGKQNPGSFSYTVN